MSDVLGIIKDLRTKLWNKYGNVLEKPLTQEDNHMTYYNSEVLKRNGFDYTIVNGTVYYTEAATHRAFIAGLRVGRRDYIDIEKTIEQRADEKSRHRLRVAIATLEGVDVDA